LILVITEYLGFLVRIHTAKLWPCDVL